MHLSDKDLAVLHILEHIEEYGTISKASEAVGIPASTGRMYISNVEKEIGKDILDSKPFEGSTITPTGRKLIKYYRKAEKYLEKLQRKL